MTTNIAFLAGEKANGLNPVLVGIPASYVGASLKNKLLSFPVKYTRRGKPEGREVIVFRHTSEDSQGDVRSVVRKCPRKFHEEYFLLWRLA